MCHTSPVLFSTGSSWIACVSLPSLRSSSQKKQSSTKCALLLYTAKLTAPCMSPTCSCVRPVAWDSKIDDGKLVWIGRLLNQRLDSLSPGKFSKDHPFGVSNYDISIPATLNCRSQVYQHAAVTRQAMMRRAHLNLQIGCSQWDRRASERASMQV